MSTKDAFVAASVLAELVALLAGWRNRRTLLWLFVATGFFADISIISIKRGLWPLAHPKEIAHVIANTYVLCSFIIVSLIYRKLVARKSLLFDTAIVLFSLVFVITTAFSGVLHFNTTIASLFNGIYAGFAIVSLYKMLQDQKYIYLERSGVFWIHVAFLIYGSGNFLLFLFTTYLQQFQSETFTVLWSIFYKVLNCVTYLLLTVALSRNDLADEFR